MNTKLLLLALFAILSYSCSNERIKLLNQAEEVLPGTWEIESIRLPGYGLGITYQGNTFTTDTILFNVGTLEIPAFSADTLSSQHGHHGKVSCILRIDAESFPYGIFTLFISGEDIFSRFEYNGPPGVHPINTQAEQFIWSSFIFNNNYIITIQDNDHIRLEKANDRDDNVITLRRI